MQRAAAAALVFSALWACSGGPSHIAIDPGDGNSIPATVGGGDAGDGGADAGDAGRSDAGDAGCTALTLAGVPAVDGCFGNAPTTASGTVNTADCSISISLGTATGPCTGKVSGASDAFDGGCQGATFTCTSRSLPGTLSCVAGTSACAILICDGGTGCP